MGAVELLGPADADHYRIAVGRFGDRHYCDPLPTDGMWEECDTAWPSVTTVKKATGEDWSHTALKRVSRALLKDPRRLEGLDDKEHFATLRMIDKSGLERDGDRGTGVHRYFELRLRGEHASMLPNDPAWGYRDACDAFFAEYEPELHGAEIVCIHRTLNGWGYGGTADAIIRIRGKLYLVDWKSRRADSEHRALPEEGAQVGAYGRCEYFIVRGRSGRAVRQRPPQLEGGLVVSIKPDGCRVYPVDLDEGFRFFSAIHAFWVARRSQHDSIGKPWEPIAARPGVERTTSSGAPLHLLSPQPQDPAAGAVNSAAPAAALEDMKRKVRARLQPLWDVHFAELMLRWPADIPPPSSSEHTAESLARIVELCREVEDAHALPFHADDAPPMEAPRAHATSPPQPAQRPEEGDRVDTLTLEALANEIAALSEGQRAFIAATAREANAHGYSFSLRVLPSVRRFETARALLFLTQHAWADDRLEDELARAIIAAATLDTGAETGGAPLGVLLGKLDTGQARRVARAAQAIGTDSLRVVAAEGALHVSGSALAAE